MKAIEIVYDTESDPCNRAYDELLLEGKSVLDDVVTSEVNCIDEIKKELAALHDGRDDRKLAWGSIWNTVTRYAPVVYSEANGPRSTCDKRESPKG